MNKLIIFFLLFFCKFTFSQSVYTNIKGDTINFDKIASQNKKNIIIFLSDRSCTGCKDNLNSYLLDIDTAKCKIYIIAELQINSQILRRETKFLINNYFTKYNELFFQYSKENKVTPSLRLFNNKKKINIDYFSLFSGTNLSKKALIIISNFLKN
jgi:hypothetical protein